MSSAWDNIIKSDLNDVFGHTPTVTATPDTDTSDNDLVVIFEEPANESLPAGAEFAGSRPHILVRASDNATLTKSSQFTINSVVYHAYKIHTEQHGLIKVELTKSSSQ